MRTVLSIALMVPATLLGLLAGRGVTQYLRNGGPQRRVVVRRTVDGFLALPGFGVIAAGMLGGVSLPPAAVLPVAFSAGYVLVRLASDLRDRRRRQARRSSLLYDTWYAMLQADPGRASQFITAWFAQTDEGRRGTVGAPADGLLAEITELKSACAHLVRLHHADPQLSAALGVLRDRMRQLDQRRQRTKDQL